MRCRSHSDGQECPGISGHRLAGESETCVHLPLPSAGLLKGWTVIRPIRYRKHDTRGVLRADHKATRLSGQLVNQCNLTAGAGARSDWAFVPEVRLDLSKEESTLV